MFAHLCELKSVLRASHFLILAQVQRGSTPQQQRTCVGPTQRSETRRRLHCFDMQTNINQHLGFRHPCALDVNIGIVYRKSLGSRFWNCGKFAQVSYKRHYGPTCGDHSRYGNISCGCTLSGGFCTMTMKWFLAVFLASSSEFVGTSAGMFATLTWRFVWSAVLSGEISIAASVASGIKQRNRYWTRWKEVPGFLGCFFKLLNLWKQTTMTVALSELLEALVAEAASPVSRLPMVNVCWLDFPLAGCETQDKSIKAITSHYLLHSHTNKITSSICGISAPYHWLRNIVRHWNVFLQHVLYNCLPGGMHARCWTRVSNDFGTTTPWSIIFHRHNHFDGRTTLEAILGFL